MNKAQIKIIREYARIVDEARASIEDNAGEMEGVQNELSDKYEAMSEKAQEGAKGQALQEDMDRLQSAIDAVGEAISTLESLQENFNELCGEE